MARQLLEWKSAVKTACLVLLLSSLAVGTAHAAEPQTLAEGSWVCSTPESYDQAVETARNWRGKALKDLKQQLLEKKLCMYVDDEDLEDLMAPFVKVLSRQGDKVKVSFTIEFYKRIQYLHRKITRVTFAGWTDAKNLRNYHQ
ncbi:hypothetical protein NKDENANG_02060 [Candidatus Entotheonellaceae bacterium PAL068K]